MNEYISREIAIERIKYKKPKVLYSEYGVGYERGLEDAIGLLNAIPAADVQEKRYCKMIPLEPDCREYTDIFICTNCHQYIHLGFYRKEYSGSFCLECGAEVKEGDTNG